MKDAFWLRHDSNAQHDERILELRAEFGWEGYGLFWAMVERMRDAQGYRLAMATMGGLATSMGLLKPKLLSMIELCCNHGLFAMDEDSAFLYSPSLCRRMEEWDTKKAALADAGKRGQAAKKARQVEATLADEASQVEATLKPPLSHPDVFLSRVEKRREEERREEPSSFQSEGAASAAAPAQEKKIEAELPSESLTIASHTGGPADVPTRKARKPVLLLTGPLGSLLNPGGLADSVQGLKKPFTQAQADQLVSDYGAAAATEIVQAMANHARLGSYVSSYVTANNWLSKRKTTNAPPHASPFRTTAPANGVAARLQIQQPDAAAGWGYPAGNRSPAPAGTARESF